jgi:uncharacterized membrane protein
MEQKLPEYPRNSRSHAGDLHTTSVEVESVLKLKTHFSRIGIWARSIINRALRKVQGRQHFRDPAELFVISMIVGFTVFFSYYSWLRYLTFRDAHDLVSDLQSLWGLTHGMSGAELKLPLSSPILYIMAVPYYFYPHAWTIFVLQAAGLALAALPLFWIAKDELKSEKAGIVLAAAYLIYPAVGNQNYAQWHVQSFAPLFLLLGFYFYKKSRWKPYVICLVFALLIQVFVPLVLIFLMVYQLLAVLFMWIKARKKAQIELGQSKNLFNWKNSLIWPLITLLVIVGYVLIIYLVMSFTPNFLGLSTESLGANVPYEQQPSIFGLALYYLSNPSALISAVQGDWLTKYQYLTQLFNPVAYLSLFDPPTLFLSLPWISAGFLTSTWGGYYYSIYNQNTCYVFPFVFVSAVYGIKRLSKLVSAKVDIGRVLVVVILISTLISAFSYSVISPMNVQQNNPSDQGGWPQVTQHHLAVMKILSFVPPEASIYAEDTIASNEHIAQRKFIFLRGPEVTTFPEYVLLDFDNPFRLSPGQTQFPYLPGSPTLEEMLANYYGIYASEDGVELWKYSYAGQPVYYVPLKRVYGPNDMQLTLGEITPLSDAFFQQVLVTPTTVGSPQWFWGPSYLALGLRLNYVALPAGDYEITFRLRLLNATPITGLADDPILLLRLVQHYGVEFVESPDKSSRLLYAHDFSSSAWQNFTMFFTLTSPRWGVAFQHNNPNAAMECEYVALTQVSPVPKPLPSGFGWEEVPYRPVAFVYGNLTKDVAPGQAIFQSATIRNESSVLPFCFADGQITMPFSSIQFFENLINISTAGNTFIDTHLNATFQVLSRNNMPYLNLMIYNKTSVSINSPYTAVLTNNLDMELSTNSSILFGFNSPWSEGIFSSYFPTLILDLVDMDNMTHAILIQYGFASPARVGPDIYYYVHPADRLDSSVGFVQMKIGDIISSASESWIPHRLTAVRYQGTFITTTSLSSSYSADFNFYAATITESPVTVNAMSANGTIVQAVPLNGTTYIQNVNGETDVGMKLDVSGLEASLMHNVSMPFYYRVNASVNTLSEMEHQYSWDLSIPEGLTYAANILFTLNGIHSTAVKNLTLNDISVKAAIEGWSPINMGNLTNTITRGSKLQLQALVYLTTLTPEKYYIGNPTITSIPFQDMNVIMGISLVPVLITGVWYVFHNRQNRKLRCRLLNKIRNYVHWRSDA